MNSCFLVPLGDKRQTIYIAEYRYPTSPATQYVCFILPATPGEQGNKETGIKLRPEGGGE